MRLSMPRLWRPVFQGVRRLGSWRAAALQANQRGLEAARALSSLAQRTPSDDPVGMGARLGLAALFVDLERGAQACAMREKIFSRPQAGATLARCQTGFPALKGLAKNHGPLLRLANSSMAEMAHAGKQHGETGVIGGGNDFSSRIEPPGWIIAVALLPPRSTDRRQRGRKHLRQPLSLLPKALLRRMLRRINAFGVRQCASCPSGSFAPRQCRPWLAL